MTTAAKRFATQKISEDYIKFRPVYPETVAKIITSYMRDKQSTLFDMALDVACGSGQSTFLLCEYFQRVVGMDISETQIEQAKLKCCQSDYQSKTNVEFIVGDAHRLPIESASVDLLTCATAWHWLDPEKFYAEAKRVLKPRGCIAVYGHGMEVVDNELIKNAFDIFIEELFQFNCFSEQNLHVLNKYKAVKLPFVQTQRFEFDFPQISTIDQILGLMSSVSMYRLYCEKFPENNLLERIKATLNAKDNVQKFSFPGYAILGIKD